MIQTHCADMDTGGAAFGPNVFLRAIEVGGQTTQGQILETMKGIVGPLRPCANARPCAGKIQDLRGLGVGGYDASENRDGHRGNGAGP